MADVDVGIAHHASPGLHEYPAFDAEIVSPELPCGSAWLANCLLELNVPIWKPWNMRVDKDWEALTPGRYRYCSERQPLQRTLPALSVGRDFDFLPAPVPRVFHYWPGFYEPVAKTILFVRDPRDALYSVWQRALSSDSISSESDFASFVREPYFHYPLTWVDYQRVFLGCWKAWLATRDHLVLRYEDYRADAVRTLKQATDFLGLSVSDSDLERATEASSFERLYKIESQSIERSEKLGRLNRAGIAHEHRRVFDASMYAPFDSRYGELFEWLGYELNPIHTASNFSKNIDSEALLNAMRIDEARPEFQRWLRLHVPLIANNATASID